MSNKTDICNLALSRIGGGEITSLDTSYESEQARHCALNFDRSLKTLIENHRWDFADKTAELTLSTETLKGHNYVYVYPGDCVKAWLIYSEWGDNFANEKFWVKPSTDGQKKLIGTDCGSAWLIYSIVPNLTLLTNSFIEALVIKIAYEILTPIKGNETLKRTLFTELQVSLNNAKINNFTEGKSTKKPNRYVLARNRTGTIQ